MGYRKNKPEENNDKLEAYLDYILCTWVGDPDQDKENLFEHELWNHYQSEVRTNNHLEGFHSKLKKLVKAPKPHIYKMINVIKKREDIVCIKYIKY